MAQAEDCFTRALAIKEKVGTPLDIANTVDNLGGVYADLGQFDKALTYRNRALALREAAHAPQAISHSLNNLATTYTSLGRFQKALELYNRVLQLQQTLGNPNEIAATESNLADIYQSLGQFDKARDYFHRALTYYESVGNPVSAATSQLNLGGLYYHLGDYNKALDCFTRALPVLESLGNPQLIADCLNDLALIYDSMGEFEKARDYYDRTLTLREANGNPQELAGALSNLGILYVNLGQYAQAQGLMDRALKLQQAVGNPQDLANSYNVLGVLAIRQGRNDQALDFYSRALKLQEAIGNQLFIATTLLNVGGVYESLGQFDRAIDYFSRARDTFQSLGDTPETAGCLNNLGIVYREQGRLAEAARAFTEAERLLTTGNTQVLSNLYTNLGVVYQQQRRYDKALDYQRRGLKMAEAIGNPLDLGGILVNLGALYFELGRYDQALACDTRALALLQKTGNRQSLSAAYVNLASLYEQQKQSGKAEAAYREAIRDAETIGEQVGDPSQVGIYQNRLMNLHAHYARLLLKRKSADQALQVVERERGRGLIRQEEQSRINVARFLNKQDSAALQMRRNAVTAAANELRKILSQPVPEDKNEQHALAQRLLAARKRYAGAENRLAFLRDSLAAKYPGYRRLQGVRPPTLQEWKAPAHRHPDTLFLEWAIVDDRATLLFALSEKEGLRAFVLPVGQIALNSKVAAWRNALLSQNREERSQAKALYDLLFTPLEKAGMLRPGRYTHLVISADGPLLDLPFAALLDRSGRRLIEGRALSATLSLSMLSWPNDRSRPAARLLCVADPLNGENDVLQTPARGGFGRLPHARLEAEAVTALFPGAVSYIGPQARKTAVQSEMNRFALLHFATHAVADSLQGMRSALLLASDDGNASFLEAREIAEMRLSAQMAVLSACRTAQGQQGGGEGLLGLAWAFRAAGCPSVVASQWSVSDEATSRLMVAFYKALKRGLAKDEALREAMLAVKKEKSAPYYWAAFQVIGDTAPVTSRASARNR